MKNILVKIMLLSGIVLSISSLSACQAMSAEIHHHKLHVDSKMSNPVFLDQLSENQSKIYVRVINTSTTSIGDLAYSIKGRLTDEGYTMVGNPKAADYILQVDVLQFGKVNMREFDKLYKEDQNFNQSALTGVGAGVGTAMLGGGTRSSLAAGAGTIMLSWFANELVENETYSMITHVHIDELTKGHVARRYDTQIASKADKVNLNFDEAKPVIAEQIAKEISAIFANNH